MKNKRGKKYAVILNEKENRYEVKRATMIIEAEFFGDYTSCINKIHELNEKFDKAENDEAGNDGGNDSGENTDFAKMSIKDLKVLAKEKKIKGYSKMNKGQLVTALS